MTHKSSQPTTTMEQTPEQRAEERYPNDQGLAFRPTVPTENKQIGYATCIRELVLPLEQSLHALMEYAQHKRECRSRWTSDEAYNLGLECSCGLSELLTRLSK